MPLRRALLSLLLLALLAACGKPKPAPETPPKAAVAANPWSRHLDQFQDAYFAANPAFAVVQGRHEFDGRLPDWSRAGIEREIARLEDARKATQGFADETLEPVQRFEKQYLLAVIDNDLYWLRDAGQPFDNPAFYLNRGLDPSVYIARPYAPPAQRLRAFLAYLRAIPGAAAQMRANLRLPLARTLLEHGRQAFAGYAEFYRGDALKAFAAVTDPALQAELEDAVEPAAKAMEDLAKWLDAERARATDAFALGPQKFARMLQMTERVDTPLAELEQIGRTDLARNQYALREACAKYLPGASIGECMAKVNADKPKGGAVEGARAQLAQLRQFIVDQKLVSIPGTEQALVDEAPAYNRANFAYIDIPGPYDKGMPSVYYIAPPDPSWSQADQDAYVPGEADLLFTSVHEIWPGHFLQFLHSNRSPFRFGQVFVGYAFAEGWAHYAEELMWEAGLGAGDPATRIGQLSNALLRNVRYLCAIGLHTKGMSVAQCEATFRDAAWQDAGNSRQQAARGTYDPAYLNYTLGKLMIRKLREDWTVSRGGRKAWLEFHDRFLSYGGPPIPLVREQMLGASDGALFETSRQ